MTRPRNLILIGMPASGKSTIGVLVAKALGLSFVDTDLLLQSEEGARLPDLLAQRGAEGFLAAENRLLSGLVCERTVVATGGSAVYHQSGMANLKGQGRVVWIDVPLGELERRLGDISSRGVVLAPGQTLAQLFHQRRPLYEAWADLRLVSAREDLEATVNALLEVLGSPVTPGPSPRP